MKKIIYGLLLSILCLAGVKAQSVNNYESKGSAGTYTALTGGTALTTLPTVATDTVWKYVYNATEKQAIVDNSNIVQSIAGIDMGFDFRYGGKVYNSFAVVGYGYIMLGYGEHINFKGNFFMMSQGNATMSAIGVITNAPLYVPKVSYLVSGEAGHKVLTVQFADIAYNTPEATSKLSYQIKLYEEDSRVEMIFDAFEGMNITTLTAGFMARFNVGLSSFSKYHCMKPAETWAQAEKNSSVMTTMATVPAFEAGQTFTFSLPTATCPTTAYKATAIRLNPGSDKMSIEVDVDTAGTNKSNDNYIVLASTAAISQPADGLVFGSDDATFGLSANGEVVSVGTMSNLENVYTNPAATRTLMMLTHPKKNSGEPLVPNTTYHYAVYFYTEGQCKSVYTGGATQQAKTSTTAPAELKITESSLSQVKFSAKANDLNEQIAILVTTGKGEDSYGNSGSAYRGNFAEIPANAAVGDKYTTSYTLRQETITDTTEVLYIGAASEAIPVTVALESNRIYYFGAVSKGKDNGAYSTLVADAEPYLTPAALPFTDNFKNLSTSPEYDDEDRNPIPAKIFIGGWAGTTKFQPANGGGVVSTLKEEPGEAVLVIPALDFPTDSNVLVNISMSTVYWSGYSTSDFYAGDWKEGDSICLEISKDGGKTFEFVKVIHKETESKNLNNVVLKDYLGAKQAVLRLRVKAAAGAKLLNVSVSKINITALPFCPEPGKPRVSRVYGGTLGLTWTASVNAETQWNISTAAAVAEGQEPAWSRPALVTEKPYYLTGLADQEIYNVRIQAVCEGGRTSGWVESQVQAGRVPSFTEDFNELFDEDGDGPQLPANWQSGYYYISSWSGPYTSWYSGLGKFYGYKTKEAITAESTGYNGSLAFDMQHSGGYVHLLQTPMVELNPAEKPQLTFDAAFGSWADDVFGAMPADNQKDTMRLAMWVCDSGRFNIANVPAQEWKVAELATWNAGKTTKVDLSEYVTEAKVASVVLAIFTETAAGDETHMLYLDNIGIVNTTPLARSLKVAALSAEEATIQWVADKNVEKWLVKLEGGSLTAPHFFEDVAGNTQVFDGLEAEQTYTASVTPAGNGKDAVAERWVSVQFTTLAASCPEPTALSVSNVEQRTAVLSWEGEAAEGYYVHYRPVAAQGAEAMPWISVRVNEGTTYTLSGLTPGTAYECEVEGVCSEVAEFYSERVALEGGFTTKAITCFAPTDLRCPEATLTHKSAKVSWTGTSAGYQVAWTVQNSNAWTYSEVVNEAAYTIKGLNYNGWYTFKVRGVCAAGDSSDWSETRNFRTLARPACANPTNLRVESLTQTSANLKWDYAEADEGDLASFTLRHREASVQAWDSIKEVEGTTYAIKDMKPKTAYIWNVMALCQDDRSSEWLNLRFTTLDQDTVPTTPPDDTTAVEDLKLATGLYVAAAQGQIHVMNPKSVRIDNIRIYGLNGQRLEQYAIRSTDNVILTTAVRQRVAIVEVESAGRYIRFKVMLP